MNLPFFLIITYSAFLGSAHGQDRWTWQNPYPQGNHLTSVFFTSPTEGHAVGVVGTILKTTDGGNGWNGKFLDAGARFASVYFPGRLIGYAVGTQKASDGLSSHSLVVKTTDGGESWNLKLSAIGKAPVSVFFMDANQGYLGTDSGGVFVTSDGGDNWKDISVSMGGEMRAIFFKERDTGFVGSSQLFLKTTDGGKSWLPAIDAAGCDIHKIQFHNQKVGFAIGTRFDSSLSSTIPLILKTSDGGSNWNQIPVPRELTGGTVAGQFLDESTGYLAAANASIFETRNGGADWKRAYSLEGAVLLALHHSGQGIVYGVGMGGLILKADQDGIWTRLDRNAGLSASLSAVHFLNLRVGFAAGRAAVASRGILLKTQDGGATWDSVSGIGPAPFVAIEFPEPSTGYLVSAAGDLVKTVDGGKSWTSSTMPKYPGSVKAANFPAQNLGYVILDEGVIIKTQDGGSSWGTLKNDSSMQLTSIHCLSELFCSISGKSAQGALVLNTRNGGATWTRLGVGESIDLRGLRFLDDNVGYAVGSGILKTVDGGANWVTQVEPGRFTLNGVHFLDVDTGYAVGNNVLLKTADGGANWAQNPLPANENLLALCFPDRSTGFAVGGWATILRLDRSGGTWISRKVAREIPYFFGVDGSLLIRLSRKASVSASLVTLNGRQEADLAKGVLRPGIHKLELPGKPVPKGNYLLDLRIDGSRWGVRVNQWGALGIQ